MNGPTFLTMSESGISGFDSWIQEYIKYHILQFNHPISLPHRANRQCFGSGSDLDQRPAKNH